MIDLHFFFGTTLHFPTRSATEIHCQLLMVESEEEIRGPKSVRVERTNSVEEGNDALTDGPDSDDDDDDRRRRLQ